MCGLQEGSEIIKAIMALGSLQSSMLQQSRSYVHGADVTFFDSCLGNQRRASEKTNGLASAWKKSNRYVLD